MSDSDSDFDKTPDEEGSGERVVPRSRASYSRHRTSQRSSRMFGLQVGDVIGSSFSIWFGNFVPFTALALLLYSPFLVIGYIFWSGSPTDEDIIRHAQVTGLANMLFFSQLLTGTVTFGVVMQMMSKRVTMGRCLTVGLSRLLHVLVIGILIGLICGCWFLAPIAAAFAGSAGLALFLGLAAFVIAAIFFTTYYVAVPAVIVERIGIFRALSRSAELTKGHRWTLFGILFLFGILITLMSLPISFIVRVMMADEPERTRFILEWVFTTILAPVGSIVPAVIYHDIRVGREGASVEDLAKVFE